MIVITASLFTPLYGFLTYLWSLFIDVLAYLWSAVIDLIIWFRVESVNVTVNFIFDAISGISGSLGYSATVNEAVLTDLYIKTNFFFPVDDLIFVAILLVNTWLSVKIFRIGVRVFSSISPIKIA